MAPESDPLPLERPHPVTAALRGAQVAAILVAGATTVGLDGLIGLADTLGAAAVLIFVAALTLAALIGAVAGLASWWFTRFVIDATELRVETGVLFHQSRRIPYERIQAVDIAQPLIARLIGFAMLHIDSAGAKESRTTLRYLTHQRCRELRHMILERAHGRSGEPTDGASPDDLIVQVSPDRLLIASLVTAEFAGVVIAVLLTGLVAGIIAVVSGGGWSATFLIASGGISGALAILVWFVRVLQRQVFADWNFRLLRTNNGLRVERGLLSRSSQTIPFERIQGVAIKEPIVWRRFGWRRLEVDVAGQAAHAGNEQNATATTPTLVPIADSALATAILTEVIPHAAPNDVERTAAPRAARLFAPIGWRYRWFGADTHTIVSSKGWLERSTSVVPHARVQSVALRQGPLRRRLGLATFEVHSPDGPVNVEVRHLAADVARDAAFAELARARAAR